MRKNQRKMAIFKRLITQLNRWMIARQAPHLVRASYLSLLKREPDPDGLRAYVQALRKHGDVTSMIKDIAQSDEHWDQLMAKRSAQLAQSFAQAFSAHVTGNAPTPAHVAAWSLSLQNPSEADSLFKTALSPQVLLMRFADYCSNDLAHTLYQGLLSRDAREEELAHFKQNLREGKASQHVRSIINSHEVRTLVQQHSLDAIYLSLLGRLPDKNGSATYVGKLDSASGMKTVISAIQQSSEHKSYLSTLHGKASSQSYPSDPLDAIRTIDRVDRAYPLKDRAALLFDSKDGYPQWRKQFLRKNTRLTENSKVLLFGAFGNGNIGDKYQALAVQQLFVQHFNIPLSNIFATSYLDVEVFPFAKERHLPKSAIVDPQALNQFDLIVIGGGGLLAHPHEPLNDPNWPATVEPPMLLLGLGSTAHAIEQHRNLLHRAVFVSTRDKTLLPAYRSIDPDSQFVIDPILLSYNEKELCRFDPHVVAVPSNGGGELDYLWILKYPSNESDIKCLRNIATLIRNSPDKKHLVLGIEPALDSLLLEYFEAPLVKLTSQLSIVASLIERSKSVFSMRYHGVIFALAKNRPCSGYSQIKIKELFSCLDSDHSYYMPDEKASLEQVEASMSNCLHVSEKLHELRSTSAAELIGLFT